MYVVLEWKEWGTALLQGESQCDQITCQEGRETANSEVKWGGQWGGGKGAQHPEIMAIWGLFTCSHTGKKIQALRTYGVRQPQFKKNL